MFIFFEKPKKSRKLKKKEMFMPVMISQRSPSLSPRRPSPSQKKSHPTYFSRRHSVKRVEGKNVETTLKKLASASPNPNPSATITSAIGELTERIKRYQDANKNSDRLLKRLQELEAIQDFFSKSTDIEFIGFIGWGKDCLKTVSIGQHENISQHHALVFQKNGQIYVETLGTAIHLTGEKPLKERLKTPETLAFSKEKSEIEPTLRPITDDGRVCQIQPQSGNPGLYRAKLDDDYVDVIDAPLSQVRVLQLCVRGRTTGPKDYASYEPAATYKESVLKALKIHNSLSYVKVISSNFPPQGEPVSSLQAVSALQILLVGKPDMKDVSDIETLITPTGSNLRYELTEFSSLKSAFYMNNVMCSHFCMPSLMREINKALKQSATFDQAAVFYFSDQISPLGFQSNKNLVDDKKIGLVYQVPPFEQDKVKSIDKGGGEFWAFVEDSLYKG